MNRYKFRDGRQLRCGYTTGTCAAAAAEAAAGFLLTGKKTPSVSILLPAGSTAELSVEFSELEYGEEFQFAAAGASLPADAEQNRKIFNGVSPAFRSAGKITGSTGARWNSNAEKRAMAAVCGVRKDAGDDADITDGMLICARVRLTERNFFAGEERTSFSQEEKDGIFITGGDGVGRVTKPGLDQPVGAAAVNTVPRRMISDAVKKICDREGYDGMVFVEIFVPGGAEAAKKTFNPLLGIEGGISILGTSGIVEPMSDSAVVETIRAEIRVKARERGNFPEKAAEFPVCLAAVPGNYGMKFACEELAISEDRIVKCSNFIGDMLNACWEYRLSGILLIGNAGKLIKLTSGVMNTHSSHADARIETVIACSLAAGASLDLLRQISGCVTTEAAFSLLYKEGLAQKTMDIAAERAAAHMARRVRDQLKTGVILFSSSSGIASFGGAAKGLLEELRKRERNR